MSGSLQNKCLKKLNHPLWMVTAVFAVLLALLSYLVPEVPPVEKYCPHYPPCSEVSALRANPVAEHEEEAALRIDPVNAAQTLMRTDGRQELRYGQLYRKSVTPAMCSMEVKTGGEQVRIYFFSEIRLHFYRKLWQRILPCRAGPVRA